MKYDVPLCGPGSLNVAQISASIQFITQLFSQDGRWSPQTCVLFLNSLKCSVWSPLEQLFELMRGLFSGFQQANFSKTEILSS